MFQVLIKIVPILLIIILVSTSVYAQKQYNLDSMKIVWENPATHDTNRVKVIEHSARYLLSFKPDTLFHLAKILADFSLQENNYEWYARSLSVKAKAHREKFETEKALTNFKKAVAIIDTISNLDRRRYTVLLSDLGFMYYRLRDVEKMKYYGELQIQEATKLRYPQGLGRAYNLLASAAEIEGDTKTAVAHYQKSVKNFTISADTTSTIIISNNYSTLLLNLREFEEALKVNEHISKLAKTRKNNQQQLGRLLRNYGGIYMAQGNYALALQQYLRSKKMFEEKGMPNELVGLNNSIGLLYEKMGDFDNAYLYLNKALTYNEKAKDQYGQIINLGNLGNLHRRFNKENELTEQYYQNAYEIASAINNADLLSFISLALAAHNVKNGSIIKAEALLKAAMPMAEKAGYADELAEGYLTYAQIKIAQKLYNEARQYLQKAKKCALEKEMLDILRDIAKLNYEIEKANDDSAQALVYYEQYQTLTDSLALLANERAFSRLEAEYHFDVKQVKDSLSFIQEQQIIAAALDASKNRSRALAFGSLLFLCLSGFVFWLYKRTQKARQLSDRLLVKEKAYTSALEQEQTKVELKSLTKQMDPHFMFNSLQSISHYVSENDKKAANKYLASFAKLMRHSMNYSQMDVISLAEEIEIIRIYLELEVLRFAHAFTFKIEITNHLDTSFIEIPPMLIQPHVENAIWHGLRHRNPQKGGSINLTFNTQNNYLICQITDNGIGIKKSAEINKIQRKNHISTGNLNIKKRIKLLNKLNEHPINLEITDNNFNADINSIGTKVVVKFPI